MQMFLPHPKYYIYIILGRRRWVLQNSGTFFQEFSNVELVGSLSLSPQLIVVMLWEEDVGEEVFHALVVDLSNVRSFST